MGYFLQSTTAPTAREPDPAPVDNFGETAKNEVPEFFTVNSGRRFYSPELGRWLSRDPIGEWGGANVFEFVENNGISRRDVLGLKVEVWSRKANVCCGGVAASIGKKHEWIKTDTVEAGLGNADGIPGERRSCPDCIGVPTYVKDHSGESDKPGAVGILKEGVCEKCVNAYLVLNSRVGRWIPLSADCNTWIDHVMSMCTPHSEAVPGSAPIGYIQWGCSFGGGKIPIYPMINDVVKYPDGSLWECGSEQPLYAPPTP